VKRQWSLDDLIEHFTLLPNERQLITSLRVNYGIELALAGFW